MNQAEIRRAFIGALVEIAPDLDPACIGDADQLQADLGLDSMDVLNLVSLLHQRLGLSIPERDYPRLATPAQAVAYLATALGG